MKTLAYTYYYDSVLASQEARMRKLLTEEGENKLCANYIDQLTVKYVCCLILILWSIRVVHLNVTTDFTLVSMPLAGYFLCEL